MNKSSAATLQEKQISSEVHFMYSTPDLGRARDATAGVWLMG